MDRPNESAMTIDGLSAYLKIAKSALHKPAQEGRLPGRKVGGHWRFGKEAVGQWPFAGAET